MKKFCFVLVLTVVMVSIAPGARAALVEFGPVSQTVSLGDDVFVDLMISGLGDASAPSLGVFDLDVSFDPNILSLSNVTYTDADLGDQLDFSGLVELGPYYKTSTNVGEVNLYGLSFDAPEILNSQQADEFTLARLTFQSLNNGTSTLGISIIVLGDADANPIVATPSNGAVTVVPVPTSLLLLASALTALVGSRRKKGIIPNSCTHVR